MAQITVTIAGKLFRMACDDGQEAHLEQLAQSVDRKINDLRGAFGDIGDQRLTVMAALSMADEASETARRLAILEQDVAALKQGHSEAAETAAARDVGLARDLSALAARIERITGLVEGRDGED